MRTLGTDETPCKYYNRTRWKNGVWKYVFLTDNRFERYRILEDYTFRITVPFVFRAVYYIARPSDPLEA